MRSLILVAALGGVVLTAHAHSIMEVNPEHQLCVGDAPTTKYGQKCVARCRVIGSGSKGLGYLQNEQGVGGHYYLVENIYHCPTDKIASAAVTALYDDHTAKISAFCGEDNLVRIQASSAGCRGSVSCHGAGIAVCKTAKGFGSFPKSKEALPLQSQRPR